MSAQKRRNENRGNSKPIGFSDIDLAYLSGTLTSSLLFYVILGVVLFVAILIPLSYAQSVYIKNIWSLLSLIIWSVAVISACAYFYKRHNDQYDAGLYLLALGASLILWALGLLLGLAGLTPITDYIPPLFLISALLFLLADTFYDISFQYESYLAKSVKFAISGSRYFTIGSAFALLVMLGSVVSLGQTLSIDGLLIFVVDVIQVLIILVFLKWTLDFRLNDPDTNNNRAYMVIILSLVALVAKYHVYGTLDLWWVGTLAFLTSVFYVASNPTQRKVTRLSFAFYFIYGLMMIFSALGLSPTLEEVGKALETYVILSGILAMFAGWSYERYKQRQAGVEQPSDTIDSEETERACQQIWEAEGPSLETIETIMAICIIGKNFSYCHKLDRGKFETKDLRFYFEIYLLAAQFDIEKQVTVEVRAEEGRMTTQVIEHKVEFQRYLEDYLEYIKKRYSYAQISTSVWSAYRKNQYIRPYLDINSLKSKFKTPPSIWKRLKQGFPVFLVILVIFSMVYGMGGNVVIRSIPDMIEGVNKWTRSRMIDLRLAFFVAHAPYNTDDPDLRQQHAENFYYWIDEWVNDKNVANNGRLELTTENLHQGITWLELLLTFHADKDQFYRNTHYRLGDFYNALEDCDKAVSHFEAALEGEEDAGWREQVFTRISACEADAASF
jgi:hypothetical protein